MSQIDTGTDHLLCELRERVLIVTLNRPQARNALSPQMTRALVNVLAGHAVSAQVGALLLTGAGTAFCAGGDVKGMGDRGAPDNSNAAQRYEALRARHHGIAGALTRLRIPTVAALPGPAAGAGMAIALACDLRIASEDAFMSTGYARIGLSGDYGIAWLLTHLVGGARARQWMLTSERIGMDAAAQSGLVNRVTPADDLAGVAFETARELANGPRTALAYIKDNLDEAPLIDHATAIDREAERLLRARDSDDHREAVRAFVEKRAPQFNRD